MKQILIAGIGNIFQGDDAFGVEMIRLLSRRTWPRQVEVVDFGIRAYDLAYAFGLDYGLIILVDAVPMGKPPGTVCLIEPDLSRLDGMESNSVDAHSMTPVSVIRLAQMLGYSPQRLLVVGCEPAVLENENGELGLSEPVQAALPQAARLIDSVVTEFLNTPQMPTAGLAPA